MATAKVDCLSISDSDSPEACVLRYLRNSRGELSPLDLLDQVHAISPRLSDVDIKRAVWRLMKEGDVIFSPRQRLRANKATLSFQHEKSLDTSSSVFPTEGQINAVDGVVQR
jgi:hypothetical protein